MACSLSSTAIPASLSIPILENLARDNFRLWRAQVLPVTRAVQLEGFITGFEKASAKTSEVEKEDYDSEPRLCYMVCS
jgi:hypothetical protein